ncbi:MAG: YwqJ-related putative deaminase [Bacillota bacterium]
MVEYTYDLRPEKGIRQNIIRNEKLIGSGLTGEVIDTQNDKVRLHLDIDEQQEKDKAYWFPYSTRYTAEGNSGWYCMPELEDSVQLHFPNAKEEDGLVMNSLPQDGESNPKMTDPEVKYFGTPEDKDMMMNEQELTFSAKSEEKSRIFIKLEENNGIEVESTEQLNFQAEKDFLIEAEKNLDIAAKEGIYFNCKESSIVLDGETDFKASQLKIEATQFPSAASQEGAFADSSAQAKPKKEEKGFFGKCRSFLNKHSTAVDSIQLGLDIAGMIPAVGAVADLANAGIAAARGNYAEAGLSLVAAIPGIGQLAAAGKLGTKAGKVAKYGAKAAKAIAKTDKAADVAKLAVKHGDKIKKTAKAAKGALLGFGAYSGVKAAKGEVAEGDWINAARSAVGIVEVGRAVTSSRTVKAVKDSVGESLGDLGKNMKLKMMDKVDEAIPRVVSDSAGQTHVVSGKQHKGMSDASVSKIEADGSSGGGSKELDVEEEIFNKLDNKLTEKVNEYLDKIHDKYNLDVTRKSTGPAVAGVYNSNTEKSYFEINNQDGLLPEVIHPAVSDRIKNMPENVLNSYKKTLGPGTHAECNALNSALIDEFKISNDIDGDVTQEILNDQYDKLKNINISNNYISVQNLKTYKSMPETGMAMPRCLHCQYITNGATINAEMLKIEETMEPRLEDLLNGK